MSCLALLLAACTSDQDVVDPAEGTATESAGQGDAATGSAGLGGTAESTSPGGDDPGIAKPDLGPELATRDDEITYAVGVEEWQGFNDRLPETAATWNGVVNDRLRSGFWYFGTDGTVVPDEEFGSYRVVSQDPLTVEYTISQDAVWEDGTPITYDDYLLQWATENPAALFGGDGDPPFNSVETAFGLHVPDGPQGEPGGKTFTVVYPEAFPDWQLAVGTVLPAHVAAQESGLAPEELTRAILARDADVVTGVADFWNTGWLSPDRTLPEPALVPSSGPYSLDGATWRREESLTLVPNERYWGPPPATARLTFRFAARETYVQALANGELDVIEPPFTIDTVRQLEDLGDRVVVQTGESLAFEHLDFNFEPGRVFADDHGGQAAREAFAHCVPRQLIVDNLIAPVDPEAQVMNLREVFPVQSRYAEVVEAAYDGRYDEVDLGAARRRLTDAGLESGEQVRIGYGLPNQRRADLVSLITSSCEQAGFDIVDAGDPDFFGPGGGMDSGSWDVALFAWVGSGQTASGRAIYETDGTQNFGGYSDEVVDEAWRTLTTTVDESVHLEQLKTIERRLWEDLHGIPLFALPRVLAHDADLDNVIFTATQALGAWNAEQWVRRQ